MSKPALQIKITLRILCGDEIAMGPGKADLLEAVAQTGSISAAARAMGMSYRRAWLLVDVMNRCWSTPLVETMPSGNARSGARLSETGHQVIAHYRALQASAEKVENTQNWLSIQSHLLKTPRLRQCETTQEGR
jgi:molybdate transport system regulatory protein